MVQHLPQSLAACATFCYNYTPCSAGRCRENRGGPHLADHAAMVAVGMLEPGLDSLVGVLEWTLWLGSQMRL